MESILENWVRWMSEKRFFFLRGRGSVWLPRGAGVSSSWVGGLVDGVAGVAGGGAAAGVFLPVRLLRSLRPWVARLEENLKPKLPSPSGSLKAALFFIGVAGSSLPFFGSLDFGMLGVVSGSESTDGSSVATAESGCWSGVWRSVMVLSLVDWLVVRVVVGLLGVSRGVTGSKGGEEGRRGEKGRY